ncbi:MAG TPA: hypothetical protein VFX59_06100 [Polyangiales bacterium]|nr:hypothetical protein [Polyangiales bacterium]
MKRKAWGVHAVTSLAVFLVASRSFAGTTQLAAPIQDVLGMIMGTITTIGTLALILGVVGKLWPGHLTGGVENSVNVSIKLGLIAQAPRLVGLIGVAGATIQ